MFQGAVEMQNALPIMRQIKDDRFPDVNAVHRKEPWRDFGLTMEPFVVAELLIDEFAPDAIPTGSIASRFLARFGRMPRDEEMADVQDHIMNYGIFWVSPHSG